MTTELSTSRLRPGSFGSLLTATLALACILATGCGKKGDPTPPIRAIPAPVKDLALHQQGEDLILQFEYPKITIGGGPLPGIARIELLELVEPAPAEGTPAEVDARRFAAASNVRQALNESDLSAASTGDRIYLRLQIPSAAESEERNNYSYGVRVLASNGEISGLSNVVSMVPEAPPSPPVNLKVIPSPEGLRVSWGLGSGLEVEGFNVYRRDARSRSYRRALRSLDADTREYLDSSARFGRRYIYTVTAVVSREPLVESRLSGETEVLFQDRFSPEPPGGLVALAETDQVRLRWDPSTSSDAAAYHIYRRRGEGDFQRITPTPIREREWVDEDVNRGEVYRYRVTALDALGNEGDPGEAVAVTVR